MRILLLKTFCAYNFTLKHELDRLAYALTAGRTCNKEDLCMLRVERRNVSSALRCNSYNRCNDKRMLGVNLLFLFSRKKTVTFYCTPVCSTKTNYRELTCLLKMIRHDNDLQ